MAASLIVTASLTSEAQARIQQMTQVNSNNKEQARRNVIQILKGIGPIYQGSIRLQSAATAPVAASGTFTLVSVPEDDAVTIGAVTLTAKASPSGENQWSQAGSDTADAAALAAKINAHSVLSKVVVASSAAGVVTVTCLTPGVVGNQIAISETGSSITASGSFLSGGTGGAQDAGVTYSF